MKNFKRIAGMLLVLVMALAMMAPAFADTVETGSITINGVQVDADGKLTATYEIYKILHLESYDLTEKTYSYKVETEWRNFFTREEIRAYVELQTEKDADGNEVLPDNLYIKGWKGGDDGDLVAEFAKLALKFAQDNDIAPMKKAEKGSELSNSALVFDKLPLGYYLVDSTVGALCGLTTTNPNASINAKNSAPTIDKQVKEDLTSQWGDSNTADIGQTVEFRTTINVHAGAENYVLHDKMSSGLTFQKVVGIQHIVSDGDTETVGAEYYTILNNADNDEENNCNDADCTFEIEFTKEFCDHLETNDKVVVTYTAMVNRDAIVAGEGNPNETWLDYGEENHTAHDSTKTYTFGFDIVKTDSQNTLIDGAKFKIYGSETGSDEVAVYPLMKSDVDESDAAGSEEDVQVGYRRARADEVGVEIEVKDGQVRIVGFDNGTYYLEETVAPDGYNKLTARQKFIISDGNLDATFNGEIYSTGSGVHVVNKSGTMLPETGGIGTTLFYVIGGVLVAAAVVLLITRKRMSEK